MAATLELRPRMQKWAKIIKGVTPPVGSLLTPQSYFCPHRLMCPGALSCSPQFLEGQLSGVDSSDAKMPKDEHSSDPSCGVTFDRASWQPFYAPIGGTFFHTGCLNPSGHFQHPPISAIHGAILKSFDMVRAMICWLNIMYHKPW